MRVAFTLIGGKNWTGGYNYLLNLIRSLHKYSENDIQPVLFVGEDTDPHDIEPFQKYLFRPAVKTRLFNQSQKTKQLVLTIVRGRNILVEALFKDYHIDVVFEAATFYGFHFNIPVVAWVPDFQHRHMSNMFSFFSYWKREIGIHAQIISKRIIMLSSEDSKKDCERFYQSSVGNTYVVPFAVEMNGKHPKQSLSLGELREKYDIPADFYYLPNQFWKHKNHQVVIDGLKKLIDRGYNYVVVSSGQPLDPRHPMLYRYLRERVKKLSLENNFIFLGMIPYNDLVGLMLAAKAVINPSLFEGWSTTVEECKTLGVPLLLSDIPVHREQAEKTALFFDPISPENFADILIHFSTVSDSIHKSRIYCDSIPERMDIFCRRFQEAVFMAIKKKHQNSLLYP